MAARALTRQDVQNKLDAKFGEGFYKVLKSETYKDKDILRFKHTCGQIIESRYGNVLIEQKKCPCIHIKTGPKTDDKKAAQKRIDDRFGKKEYTLLDEYKNAYSVHQFKHKCGNIITAKWQIFIVGDNKCPCTHTKEFNRDLEKHNKEIQKWRKSKQWECVEFNGTKAKKHTYLHKKCGKTFETSLDSFRLSKGCPHCDGLYGTNNLRQTAKEIEKKVNTFQKEKYKLVNEHTTVRNEIEFKHVKCGTKFFSFLSSMLKFHHRCPYCYGKGRGRVISIEVKGKIFRCQGFEPLTLDKLAKKYSVKHIKTGSDPNRFRVNYTFNGKRHKYTPDFIIEKYKLIVETKSLATLGLTNNNYIFPKELYRRMKAKAQTCIKMGYRFELDLYDTSSKLIKLPKNWLSMTRKQVLAHIADTK